MNIDEAKRRKAEAENQIKKILNRLSEEAGLYIVAVDIDSIGAGIHGAPDLPPYVGRVHIDSRIDVR